MTKPARAALLAIILLQPAPLVERAAQPDPTPYVGRYLRPSNAVVGRVAVRTRE